MKTKIIHTVLYSAIFAISSPLSAASEIQTAEKIPNSYLGEVPFELGSDIQQGFICEWWIPLFCRQDN
ncbi:hypothetical protein FIU95_20220 [Microbulbifer sp. THAF38]|nr:hypothetical protein FIU95_20220 [Microbulbifer sp. THAF38]